ncbi:endonuclease domain-containing protein [Labrys okinawensis]|uniref:endonuclease domain-containing protein n=1 Tax=Labrys okinawensis TaxID=346911 RepID=UPI0039BC99D8
MEELRPYRQSARKFARSLRSNMTRGEEILWHELRRSQLGVRFRRDMPLGPYFPDFVSTAIRLVIEVDGRTHNEEAAKLRDNERQDWLERNGWRVLRFRDDIIIGGSLIVVETIRTAVQEELAKRNRP